MKVIVSGNSNQGLGQAIHRQWPTAFFASRSTDWPLNQSDVQDKFAHKTLEYDTYISCSALYHFNQTLLLEKVVKLWQEQHHHGRIIALGSSADAPVKATEWLYPIEKKALKNYCRNLGNLCIGGHGKKAQNFRVTYLSVGYLATEKTDQKYPDLNKLNLDYIAQLIEWIANQPLNVNIHSLSLDPVQS